MAVPSPTDREIVRRFESARTPEQLAELLLTLPPGDERALRGYLGDERFRRLYLLAQTAGASRAVRGPAGNVVVLPGIMGSELTVADMAQHQTLVWLSIPRLYMGWLNRLQLAADGREPFDPAYTATATGVLNKYYGEMVLHLSRRWKARAFWYDWRKSLAGAANDLEFFLRKEFQDQPVTVVAHSMGGLVARSLLLKEPKTADGEELISRVVMLGTPNFGSFEVPQIFAGIQDTVRQLIKLTGGLGGLFNSEPARRRLLETLDSFPGVYQMMPWPGKVAAGSQDAIEQLYDPATYAAFNTAVSADHLQTARDQQTRLGAAVTDDPRLIYVAGYGEVTVIGLTDADDLRVPATYIVSKEGDGRVPHVLGILAPERTYYVRGSHGDLARLPPVLRAIDDLVADGATTSLPTEMPAERSAGAADDPAALHRQWARRFEPAAREQEDAELGELLRRLDRRLDFRGADPTTGAPPDVIGSDERALEERLLASVLGSETTAPRAAEPAPPPPTITLALVHADIAECHLAPRTDPPIDALGGGLYTGVRPQGGVLALDCSVSAALPVAATTGGPATERLLLSEMIQRGTIRGELGTPFILPDPRPGGAGRVIALAGLGTPGGCGVPELTLCIRELCWTLNALGKKHLATLLIGAGTGNLDLETAVQGLLAGLARALSGVTVDGSPGTPQTLRHVTIVEFGAGRLGAIDQALRQATEQLRTEGRLNVVYDPPPEQAEAFVQAARAEREAHLRRELQRLHEERERPSPAAPPAKADPAPARATFALHDGLYVFSAVTDEASIPERSVDVDTTLVEQTNDKLVAAEAEEDQQRHGLVLGRLLIPRDLREHFRPGVPLVMQVDARSARIHWEMVAQGAGGARADDPSSATFLGLERGFTRQLRTAFAPPPEAPPAARRTLRVLVIGDPAADAPLRGALREAADVADLFEAFNEVYHSEVRAEVVRLFGPAEADRLTVMTRLLLEPFDVLHYAGHCFFDPTEPPRSGWIFRANPRLVLSSRELRLIDRIPRFVFSNACESGITPDRPECRGADMAPAFAEAFFERGVGNFVCTAWPVDDDAARLFAARLYAGLLGLELGAGPDLRVLGPRPPLPLYRAMQEARLAVYRSRSGRRTSGAYQHYGNPHARFFAEGIVGHARQQYKAAAASPVNGAPAAPPSAAGAAGDRRRTGAPPAGEVRAPWGALFDD